MTTFPAVVVTGPRQSGKTTLLHAMCSRTHRYPSLEDPDIRIRAREDPLAFLDRYPPPVIYDEIQYVPELLSYIKTRIDEHRLLGSGGSQARRTSSSCGESASPWLDGPRFSRCFRFRCLTGWAEVTEL